MRRQSFLQLGLLLLPLVTLPIAVSGTPAPATTLTLGLLWALVAAAGLPFFVVTTASPVLQRWFSECGDAASRDPYFLYAAGNAGSLLGLLAYPILDRAAADAAGAGDGCGRPATPSSSLLAALCTLRLLAHRAAPVPAAAAREAAPQIARLTAAALDRNGRVAVEP